MEITSKIKNYEWHIRFHILLVIVSFDYLVIISFHQGSTKRFMISINYQKNITKTQKKQHISD